MDDAGAVALRDNESSSSSSSKVFKPIPRVCAYGERLASAVAAAGGIVTNRDSIGIPLLFFLCLQYALNS